jgi:hypothetical protein
MRERLELQKIFEEQSVDNSQKNYSAKDEL